MRLRRLKFLVAFPFVLTVAWLVAPTASAEPSENASCAAVLIEPLGPPGLFHVEFGLGMTGFGRDVVSFVAQYPRGASCNELL